MKTQWNLILVSCLLVLFSTACSSGDQTVNVPAEPETVQDVVPESNDAEPAAPLPPRTDLGSIQGHVALLGIAPGNRVIRMGIDPRCARINTGKLMVGEDVVTTREGDLANVFVNLEGDFPQAPPPAGSVEIDQQGCVYIPHVVGVQVGQTVEIHNSDDLLHNLHLSSGVGNGFNVEQPTAGLVYRFQAGVPEIMMHLGCDVHRWMSSYIGIVDHPHFDVSNNDGTFTIEKVPEGTYTIHTWHEVYGDLTQTVEVRTDQITTVSVQYSVDEESR